MAEKDDDRKRSKPGSKRGDVAGRKFGGKPRGGAVSPRHKGKSFGGKRSRLPPSAVSQSNGPGISPARGETTQPSERIAKRLARAGIASRRDAEALIVDGRVRVNGEVISSPAFNVSPTDRIEVDGTEIPPMERTRLFLFHKPAGVVTTNRDPEGRPTVFEVLPKDLPRLITVGRLDINTEGLLLLTNDGGLARVLELPSTGWLRRYRVRVHGKVEQAALAELKNGIAVDGVFYGSIEASLDREQGTNAWLTIGLREGKNREVKNVLGALGLEVTRLIRVSYGPFQLADLPEGAVQELKGRTLRDQLGERLIEEASANFEAPVVKPFPNRPVRRGDEEKATHGERPGSRRERVEDRVGEGGLIKRRRRHDRSDDRDSALSRLSTKPDTGRPFAKKGRPFGKGGEKPAENAEPRRERTSNVWMAPGARPKGKKSETVTPPSPRSRGEGKGEGRHFDSKGEGRRFDSKGEGRRFDSKGEGRRFDSKGEGRHFDSKGEGRRFDSKGEGRRFDSKGEGRRFDNKKSAGRSIKQRDEGSSALGAPSPRKRGEGKGRKGRADRRR